MITLRLMTLTIPSKTSVVLVKFTISLKYIHDTLYVIMFCFINPTMHVY